jgi:thiol-disulfide isomerase/thioredoxin
MRHSAGLLLLGALGVGCKEEGEPKISAPRERSQAVQATTPAVLPQAEKAVLGVASAAAPKKARGPLCPNLVKDGKSLPKKPVSRASLNDAKLADSLGASAGQMTWINFWAAWCAPCKEEIPRLVGWERELVKSGRRFHLAFVSLDDDERQLRQVLEGSSALKATYWLKEGKEREDWMKGAGLEVDPELPIHLLVDAHGHIRCKIQGAVDDGDLADFSRLVTASGD